MLVQLVMMSLFSWADSPQLSGLRVAALGVHLSRWLLYVFLRFIPVLHPASVQLPRGPVAFSRTSHRTVSLGDVARLLCQLVLIYKTALLFAGFFRVSPWLFLPRCEEPVKYHASVMHERSNEEDILPLFTSLGNGQRLEPGWVPL